MLERALQVVPVAVALLRRSLVLALLGGCGAGATGAAPAHGASTDGDATTEHEGGEVGDTEVDTIAWEGPFHIDAGPLPGFVVDAPSHVLTFGDDGLVRRWSTRGAGEGAVVARPTLPADTRGLGGSGVSGARSLARDVTGALAVGIGRHLSVLSGPEHEVVEASQSWPSPLEIAGLSFTADHEVLVCLRTLATQTEERGVVGVFRPSDGSWRTIEERAARAHACASSRDGQWVAVAWSDGAAAYHGDEAPLRLAPSSARAVAFAGGTRLVAAGAAEIACVDLPATAPLWRDARGAVAVAVDPSGELVVVAHTYPRATLTLRGAADGVVLGEIERDFVEGGLAVSADRVVFAAHGELRRTERLGVVALDDLRGEGVEP